MYYRNITDIIADQNVEIEAGSLWKLDEETFILTLVDDDQYITVDYVAEAFQYVAESIDWNSGRILITTAQIERFSFSRDTFGNCQ